MKVVFCSSEVFPYAKTGGLADVAGALPYTLAAQGHEVRIFMPLYKGIRPTTVYEEYGIIQSRNIEIIFVKHDDYFLREALYNTKAGDYPDNLERFAFFSNQVLALLKKINFKPDIVHCNDWQTAPLLLALKTKYADDPFYAKTKSCLTIHNLAYQGLSPKNTYSHLGIDWKYFNVDFLEYYGKINLLKGGIVFADMVNTVSPTYAKQITTKEYGCGLEGVLSAKKDKLCGILNAIDYTVWNPQTDSLIYKKYSGVSCYKKAYNKQQFQKELGLTQNKDILMLGMVTRLAEQKGLDILSGILESVLKKHQVVILGLGDEKYHKILKTVQRKYKKSFSLNLRFDETIAHKIYASSDAFLMPSRFEPCGLSQMISYKYLTVPLVHATGGLKDTVTDVKDKGGGFVFTEYSKEAFLLAIERCFELFKQKTKWASLLKTIEQYNFSWEKAAKEYAQMYKNTKRTTPLVGARTG